MSITRLSSGNCVVVVIDIQDKLLTKIPSANVLLKNASFLLDVAKLVDVPVLATEQYPKGLGPTHPTIRDRMPNDCYAKTSFSCLGAPGFLAGMRHHKPEAVVVVGMETHVCVMQTVLDLLDAAYTVVLPVDAVGARYAVDHKTGLRRMERSGAVLTTVEAVGFEWLRDSSHPQFKAFSRLLLQHTETP